MLLPDSKEIEEKLKDMGDDVKDQSSESDGEAENEESQSSPSKEKSPWRIGVHHGTPEEVRPSQVEDVLIQDKDTQQQLRRTSRQRKPNPKYANAAMVENTVKEPSSYDEAARSID